MSTWGTILGTVLFLIILLIVFIVNRVVKYCIKYGSTVFKRGMFTDYYCKMKSGDLLLFVPHVHRCVNSVITCDIFSHTAMVVEIDKELYLTESAGDLLEVGERLLKEGKGKTGTQLYRLCDYIFNYPGDTFVSQLNKPLNKEQCELMVKLAHVYTPYPGAFQVLGSLIGLPIWKKYRHCMQHCLYILDCLGLTPKTYMRDNKYLIDSGIFASSHVTTRIQGIPLGKDGDYHYGEIIHIIPNMRDMRIDDSPQEQVISTNSTDANMNADL